MIKKVSAVVIVAALIAVLIGVFTWPGEAQQRTPSLSHSQIITASVPPVFDQNYTAGMRIIHVPQRGAVLPRAAAKTNYREDVEAIDDDVEPTAAPQRHRAVAPPQPRRVLPPANEPKRTMLNPPKALHDGPSPVRPLPRWRGIEKFTELPKQIAPPAPVADPVAAPIPMSAAPTDSSSAASASDIPVIDNDAPPPTD